VLLRCPLPHHHWTLEHSPPSRSRVHSRTGSVHVEVNNKVNDSQIMEDDQSIRSRSRSRESDRELSRNLIQFNRRYRSHSPRRHHLEKVPYSVFMPYHYPSQAFDTNNKTWIDSRSRSEATALSICSMRGQSHSPNRHQHWPHIPPTMEEKAVILAESKTQRG
jgi:hypothetical protein